MHFSRFFFNSDKSGGADKIKAPPPKSEHTPSSPFYDKYFETGSPKRPSPKDITLGFRDGCLKKYLCRSECMDIMLNLGKRSGYFNSEIYFIHKNAVMLFFLFLKTILLLAIKSPKVMLVLLKFYIFHFLKQSQLTRRFGNWF